MARRHVTCLPPARSCSPPPNAPCCPRCPSQRMKCLTSADVTCNRTTLAVLRARAYVPSTRRGGCAGTARATVASGRYPADIGDDPRPETAVRRWMRPSAL
jgi:hypothetical protein